MLVQLKVWAKTPSLIRMYLFREENWGIWWYGAAAVACCCYSQKIYWTVAHCELCSRAYWLLSGCLTFSTRLSLEHVSEMIIFAWSEWLLIFTFKLPLNIVISSLYMCTLKNNHDLSLLIIFNLVCDYVQSEIYIIS